jgi:hypothetical protein
MHLHCLNNENGINQLMLFMFIGGDMATTRGYLDIASRASTGLLDGDMPITSININCLDPLGRSALSIG